MKTTLFTTGHDSNSSLIAKKRRACIRKFLYYFPGGFQGKKYLSWERSYKWLAHERWCDTLNKQEFESLLKKKQYEEIARRAVTIESKTNLLFSFEKMAVRDAVKTTASAKLFSIGLYQYLYGEADWADRFIAFRDILSALPVKQTRVLTWPLLTVFGFIAQPAQHIFLKPVVTRAAAMKYQYDLVYNSRPNWETYYSLLQFANLIKKDTAALHPRDMIDIQSFIWVMGSEEYPD